MCDNMRAEDIFMYMHVHEYMDSTYEILCHLNGAHAELSALIWFVWFGLQIIM